MYSEKVARLRGRTGQYQTATVPDPDIERARQDYSAVNPLETHGEVQPVPPKQRFRPPFAQKHRWASSYADHSRAERTRWELRRGSRKTIRRTAVGQAADKWNE